MTTPVLSLQKIGQIAIPVNDVAAARAFYRDILGLTPLFDAGPAMAFFACGGMRIMITRPTAPEYDHPSSILYFPVDDLDQAHAALARAGVVIESPPRLIAKLPDHELWMCFFRDPARNLLALMAEKPLSPR